MNQLDEKTNEALYLEFINDFLTIHAMAEYYGVSRYYLKTKIEQGRKDRNKRLGL